LKLSLLKLYNALGSTSTSITDGFFDLIAAFTASLISETFVTLKPLAPYNFATLSNGGLSISAPRYLFPKKSFWYFYARILAWHPS